MFEQKSTARDLSRKGAPARAHLDDLLRAVRAFEEELAVARVDRKLAQIKLSCGRHLGRDRGALHADNTGHLATSIIASCEGSVSLKDHAQPHWDDRYDHSA